MTIKSNCQQTVFTPMPDGSISVFYEFLTFSNFTVSKKHNVYKFAKSQICKFINHVFL